MGAVIDILRGKVNGSQLALAGGRRLQATTGIGGGLSFGAGAGLALDPEARAYSGSAVAYRCVMTTATNLASVDLAVATEGTDPDPDHEVARLWNRRPNPAWSARAQKEVVFARCELVGEQLLYVNRGENGTGPATELWPIFDPVEVVVAGRRAGQLGAAQPELLGYRVRVSGGVEVRLLPGEVLWLRYPHPFDPWGAMAPWKAALYAVESDAYARAWQRGEFQHGARPSSVVYLGDLDEDAHKAAVAEFRGKVEGPENAGKSLLVSSQQPAKVEHLSLSPAEMSYLESRAHNSAEVALAFGYRVDDLLGGSTYENQRAAKTARWSDLLVPKLEVLASETDRQLLPDLRQTAVFDVSSVEALRENEDALIARTAAVTASDLVLLDEAREALGYDPLPGGIGAQTITAYRAQLRGGTLTPEPGGPVPERAAVRLYVGASGLHRVVRARTAPVAALVVRARRRDPQRFYDRHERIGHRAVGKLAARQERVVLAALRKLVRQNPRITQEWAQLAASSAVRIASSAWTQLPVSWRPSGLAGPAENPPETRVAADDLIDNAYWRARTQEYLEAFMAGVWEGGAADVAGQLGLSLDLFDNRVLQAMANRAEVLSSQVTETTRRVLDAQLLQAGVEGGESIDQLTARVRAVFEDLSTWRATAIARTETVGGFNAASRIGAISSGQVAARTWLAAHDDRVRDSHVAIDGEQVNGTAGRYSNGLLHPGDPTGDPSETVNCRCVETYQLREDT